MTSVYPSLASFSWARLLFYGLVIRESGAAKVKGDKYEKPGVTLLVQEVATAVKDQHSLRASLQQGAQRDESFDFI